MVAIGDINTLGDQARRGAGVVRQVRRHPEQIFAKLGVKGLADIGLIRAASPRRPQVRAPGGRPPRGCVRRGQAGRRRQGHRARRRDRSQPQAAKDGTGSGEPVAPPTNVADCPRPTSRRCAAPCSRRTRMEQLDEAAADMDLIADSAEQRGHEGTLRDPARPDRGGREMSRGRPMKCNIDRDGYEAAAARVKKAAAVTAGVARCHRRPRRRPARGAAP